MSAALFAILIQLLNASPVGRESAEKILNTKLEDFNHNEMSRDFHNFKASAKTGPWSHFEFQVPKARGGITMTFDLRAGPRRPEILNRFGPAKPGEYQSGTQTVFTQDYKTQTLTWVLEADGHAARLVIQDGR